VSAAVAFVSLLVVGALVVTTELDRPSERVPDSQGSAGAGARSFAWSDEFNGPRGRHPDPRRWTLDTGYGWGDRELQSYTGRAANAALDGRGRLAITARRERYTGADGRTAHYTSARLNSRTKFEFAYGRVEARIRVPRGRGLLPAFWALGNDVESAGWPRAGEIDMMEVNGSEPFTLHGTLHGPRAGHKDYALEASRLARTALARRFHVYGVSWSPGRIAFRLDGKVYAVRRRSDLPAGARWTFDHPFFLLFTLAVGPRWLGPPDASTPWPATMLVDWVRVRSGPATFCPTVRVRELRSRCPRRPRGRTSTGSERGR
jgi:beta-glucanase (GH16 family)